MKHRISYIRDRSVPFEPSQITVGEDSVHIRDLQGAKEHRLTIGLQELPSELADVLENSHELHLRWQSPRTYNAASPLNSRVSPGLHVFFTPLPDKNNLSLCPTLGNLFGQDIKCSNINDTFTSPPVLSKRFATSASTQYHQNIFSLAALVQYIQSQICMSTRDASCQETAFLLLTAQSLDVDYDAISHSLNIAAYWDSSPDGQGWIEQIKQSKNKERIEIGILNQEKPTEAEALSMGGFLAVVGQDTKLKSTLFSFPSRHHPLPSSSSFTMAFDTPTGLHPTLRISIDAGAAASPPHSSCSLHTYLTLPSHLFLDRHQFSDKLFLASHNLASLRAISGATDLEAPDWVVPQWGSASLFELAPVDNNAKQQKSRTYDVTLPMHFRYLPPAPGGHVDTFLPYPAVFWACHAEQGSKMAGNPFDRRNLGYDGLFGDRTMFYHLSPAPHQRHADQPLQLVDTVAVPVLDSNQSSLIEPVTVGVVVTGFVWLLWKLLRPVSHDGSSSTALGDTKAKVVTKKGSQDS